MRAIRAYYEHWKKPHRFDGGGFVHRADCQCGKGFDDTIHLPFFTPAELTDYRERAVAVNGVSYL